MGEVKGFLKYKRRDVRHRPVKERIHDFAELDLPLTPEQIHQQTARCMDCGIPFCHGAGCPLKNCIPDLNELVYKGKWQQACELLHSTNNFPEITGRVCPAPCETACTLSINDEPVLIRHIEFQIVERGFQEGWIKPLLAKQKTGKKIAVVGSGPAGLTVAQQLARTGHSVVVFEKDERIGGLLRYGIPDFKLAKGIIDRRLEQLIAEGVEFQTDVNVGENVSASYLKKRFDCICLTMGAGQPRDLNIVGRGYENILFATDYLKAQNKLCSGEPPPSHSPLRRAEEGVDESTIITAKNKVVVVIGGGDTGSDCVGTALRQGAKQIYQLEILPEPPETRPPDTPWPMWPRIMRTSSSHEEGCQRQWSVMTKKFSGVETRVTQLHCCKVEWIPAPASPDARRGGGRKNGSPSTSLGMVSTSNHGSTELAEVWKLKELPGSDFIRDADVVLLAMGFLHVTHNGLVKELGLDLDESGNLAVENCQTSEPSVFAAGDTISGSSLVVRAINSGREAAAAIDDWLKKY